MSAIAPADASAQTLGAEASAGAIADMYEDHNALKITLSCVECRIFARKLAFCIFRFNLGTTILNSKFRRNFIVPRDHNCELVPVLLCSGFI